MVRRRRMCWVIRRHPLGTAPGSVVHLLRSGLRRGLLVLGVRLQHEIADALLRARVSDRTQQRKAATFTVDRVLASGEGDVAATTRATLPDGEADQLQAFEHAVGEMQLGIREFARGGLLVVW